MLSYCPIMTTVKKLMGFSQNASGIHAVTVSSQSIRFAMPCTRNPLPI